MSSTTMTHEPMFANFKSTSTFSIFYGDLDNGESRADDTVKLRGVVLEKRDAAHNFKMYVIADHKSRTDPVKVIYKESYHDDEDEVGFEEMHGDVEEGDYVTVIGFPSRSKKGNLCVWGSSIQVNKYGNNHYEKEVEEEEEVPAVDENYVPDEEPSSEDDDQEYEDAVASEDEDETDIEEEELEEEESEEKPEEKVENDVHPLGLYLQVNHNFEDIPLKVYKEFVDYQGVVLRIRAVYVGNPGRVTIVTKIGNFKISRLDKDYIGVVVPENPLELEYRNGYDLITRGSFRKILNILQ